MKTFQNNFFIFTKFTSTLFGDLRHYYACSTEETYLHDFLAFASELLENIEVKKFLCIENLGQNKTLKQIQLLSDILRITSIIVSTLIKLVG